MPSPPSEPALGWRRLAEGAEREMKGVSRGIIWWIWNGLRDAMVGWWKKWRPPWKEELKIPMGRSSELNSVECVNL